MPYIHVVVNNSYLGLIRQAQRGFDMDYHVQLSFENINAPELGVYGVDHVAVAEGLGCKAIRVTDPKDAQAAFTTARELMAKYSVPVVVEFILERVTNIAMGTEIDNIVEFEEILDLPLDDAPTGATARSRFAALEANDERGVRFSGAKGQQDGQQKHSEVSVRAGRTDARPILYTSAKTVQDSAGRDFFCSTRRRLKLDEDRIAARNAFFS